MSLANHINHKGIVLKIIPRTILAREIKPILSVCYCQITVIMKKILILIILFTPLLLKAQCTIYTENLRCEYLDNPEGIDEPLPRLSWTIGATNAKAFGQRQTAYQVIVGNSE